MSLRTAAAAALRKRSRRACTQRADLDVLEPRRLLVVALAGDDRIFGNFGSDLFDGGDGDDTAVDDGFDLDDNTFVSIERTLTEQFQ